MALKIPLANTEETDQECSKSSVVMEVDGITRQTGFVFACTQRIQFNICWSNAHIYQVLYKKRIQPKISAHLCLLRPNSRIVSLYPNEYIYII